MLLFFKTWQLKRLNYPKNRAWAYFDSRRMPAMCMAIGRKIWFTNWKISSSCDSDHIKRAWSNHHQLLRNHRRAESNHHKLLRNHRPPSNKHHLEKHNHKLEEHNHNLEKHNHWGSLKIKKLLAKPFTPNGEIRYINNGFIIHDWNWTNHKWPRCYFIRGRSWFQKDYNVSYRWLWNIGSSASYSLENR